MRNKIYIVFFWVLYSGIVNCDIFKATHTP